MKLVPFDRSLFEKLYEWQLDDDIRKSMGGMSVPLTEGELEAEYTMFLTGKTRVYGVALDSGEIVGAFMLENILLRHKRFDMHIVFDPKHAVHVRGGCTLFLDHMFKENNFTWAHCIIPEGNSKVQNLLERGGAKKRCTIPEYYNFSDGIVSGHLYSLHKNKRKF